MIKLFSEVSKYIMANYNERYDAPVNTRFHTHGRYGKRKETELHSHHGRLKRDDYRDNMGNRASDSTPGRAERGPRRRR